MVYQLTATAAEAATNPDLDYAPIGFGADGTGTTLTSHATNAHSIGDPVQLSADIGAAASGLIINVGQTNTVSNQFILELSIDNQVSWLPGLYMMPGSNTGVGGFVTWPKKVPANAPLHGRVRGSAAASTVKIGVELMRGGVGFDNMELIYALDTANTRAATPNIPGGDGTQGWTELEDDLARDYGAMSFVVSDAGVNPGTLQGLSMLLALGEAAAEVEFFRFLAMTNAGSPRLARGFSRTVEKAFTATERLSAKAITGVAGDNYRLAAYGFWN